MKTLTRTRAQLEEAGRWDIDFHLPAERIRRFPVALLRRIDEVADIPKDHRDPTKTPETAFLYIDIASVDVTTGVIANPQDVEGSEAPSRARQVVQAFDVVVSTCRPTRGAIAVVPRKLHDQIASTAFSIVRPHPGINPFYVHYALRLPSTLEQFRKWSTGSSYPAILDSDVKKTLIPVPESDVQDAIAAEVMAAMRERGEAIWAANEVLRSTVNGIAARLSCADAAPEEDSPTDQEEYEVVSLAQIAAALGELAPITVDRNGSSVEREQLPLM